MTIKLIEEFKLSQEDKAQISSLVQLCFPEEDYKGKTYFKQLPHYRVLLKDNEVLVGQLGLDYRVMTLGGQPIKVLGIIDFAIHPRYQGRGLGLHLLQELDKEIKTYTHNIDFLLLVADKHSFYEKVGFKLINQKCKWLATENHINYGLQEGSFNDSIMIKQVGTIIWNENDALDWMGYWY